MSLFKQLNILEKWKNYFPQIEKMNKLNCPDKITVHHTNSNPGHALGSIQMLYKIKKLHVDHRGWGDVGYHFIIDIHGKIFAGRDIIFSGAHVAGANQKNIGVSVIGDFNVEHITPALENSLTELILSLIEKFSISKQNVLPHRFFTGNKPGSCPGDYLFEWLQGFKSC